MRSQPSDTRASAPPRGGFTLIELLVAITIIAVLISLLVLAVRPAMGTVREGQVQSEISRLNSALADFKAHFGVYPPSSITLYENSADWAADPRSQGLVRQLWPQYTFGNVDINSDGTPGQTHNLTGAECLLVFLGGVTAPGTSAPIGFSANPSNPFDPAGSNRVGPFFEFDINRIVDVDADLVGEFKDTLPDSQNPYVYLSAYDGAGYLAADLVVGSSSDLTSQYLQAATVRWNPKTFQIISPGGDGQYGPGGIFNPDTATDDLIGPREAERDNITSFHNGRLAPN